MARPEATGGRTIIIKPTEPLRLTPCDPLRRRTTQGGTDAATKSSAHPQALDVPIKATPTHKHQLTNTNSQTPTHKHQLTHTNSQTPTHKHQLTNTNSQTSTHKHQLTNTNSQTPTHKTQLTNTNSQTSTHAAWLDDGERNPTTPQQQELAGCGTTSQM
jgi:hypothetical protein